MAIKPTREAPRKACCWLKARDALRSDASAKSLSGKTQTYALGKARPHLTDAVEKVGGAVGLVALAAAGLSRIVRVFLRALSRGCGFGTDATERHWHRDSHN